MKVFRILLFIIGGTAVIVAVVAQIEAVGIAFQPTGYPKRPAIHDTREIYAQFSPEPRLEPAIARVRELVQEKGQLQKFWVTNATTGRSTTPTAVHVSVQRDGIMYSEYVTFDKDGTFIEITSTEVERFGN